MPVLRSVACTLAPHAWRCSPPRFRCRWRSPTTRRDSRIARSSFPQDLGSHPDFRTEWWYVTGWLDPDSGEPLGFQITFFRTRPAIDEANPSAFTPRQLLIAHCALSDPKRGRLWQDQKHPPCRLWPRRAQRSVRPTS